MQSLHIQYKKTHKSCIFLAETDDLWAAVNSFVLFSFAVSYYSTNNYKYKYYFLKLKDSAKALISC